MLSLRVKKSMAILIGVMAVTLFGITPQAKEQNKSVVDFNAVTEQETTQESNQEESGISIKKDSQVTENNTLFEGSDVSTGLKINDDYQFGDDMLPEVDVENFFEKIYKKLFSGISVAQQIVAYIIIFFMIISLVSIVISCFGAKNKILWFIGSFFICLLVLFVDLYAVQIASAFVHFFAS